jgi:ketosteroid isomerase-like protein
MEEASSIGELVRHYIDVFNQADFEACAECYRFPLSFITPAGVAVLSSREEFLAMWRQTHAALVAQGWARSTLDETHVRLLDANLAFGSIKVTRLRGDGSVMETAGGVYTLRKGREGWKIVANVMQDVGNMLRFGG